MTTSDTLNESEQKGLRQAFDGAMDALDKQDLAMLLLDEARNRFQSPTPQPQSRTSSAR